MLTSGKNLEALNRLTQLREKLFKELSEREKDKDAGFKSYDGAFAIRLPSYFDCEKGWTISLDCYAVGPGRHYHWWGKTLEEAVTNCETDVLSWFSS